MKRKFLWFKFVALPLFFLWSSIHTGAQRGKPAAKRARSTRTAAVHDCGSGVTLGLTGASAAQGGLLELTLRTTSSLNELKAEWGGKPLPLWAGAGNVEHGLLGVDLERAPGNYEVQVSGQLAGGGPLACSATVDVTTGRFVIERLKVAPGFVELSPQDEARAARESADLHEILAQVTPERLWTGGFRFPIAGRHTGRNFGTRRVLNGQLRSPHTGLDIPAPAGTPIHAAQSGRVALAENLFFSGNTVILDHGLGVYTFYGHMKLIKVKEGEEVKAGEILGLVGATGRATGPHLHWGLTVAGARVNPLGIIRLPLH
jgi:murein DD-endopeptidase MepM/ murein hydrolase activator NlpD